MRTNAIPKYIYDTLPHQIGQKVSVQCHDKVWRPGKIHNMIGTDGGTSYTMHVEREDGVLEVMIQPGDVIVI